MHLFGAMEGNMFFGTRIIWSIAVGSLWIATGACPLELWWDQVLRLTAESIKQGNTLFCVLFVGGLLFVCGLTF